jgi:hypothetical protein
VPVPTGPGPSLPPPQLANLGGERDDSVRNGRVQVRKHNMQHMRNVGGWMGTRGQGEGSQVHCIRMHVTVQS